MKKNELIPLLISDYTNAIARVSELNSNNTIFNFLDENTMDMGVCFFTNQKYKVHIYHNKWVKRNVNEFKAYWGDTPGNAILIYGKEECITALQVRLNILKRELEIPEEPDEDKE